MRFILSMLAVFALGAIVLTACQKSAAPVAKAPTNQNSAAASAPKKDEHGHEDGATRITLAEAKAEFDAGNAVFVDTRDAAAFRQERIKGAINIPTEAVATRYTEIPTGKKVIAYCS